MLFPRFTQRTDCSTNIHRFSAQLEQSYIKLTTIHFIESFRSIQLEIDAVITNRPEWVALLTEYQQETLHDMQVKSKVRFAQAAHLPNTKTTSSSVPYDAATSPTGMRRHAAR